MAWFIAPYKIRPGNPRQRYCAMDDFTAQIRADGGDWSETEVLGDCAVVKVKASSATLATINAEPGFQRVPVGRLDDPLSSLSAGQRQAIRNRVLAMGYTAGEVQASLGSDLGGITLRELFQFVTQRRKKPRWDEGTQTIVFDGPIQPVRPIASVDSVVGD